MKPAKFQLIQTTNRMNENKECLNELNELKFCEVSRIFFQTDKEEMILEQR